MFGVQNMYSKLFMYHCQSDMVLVCKKCQYNTCDDHRLIQTAILSKDAVPY